MSAVRHRLWICAGEAGCDRILASPSIANAVAAGVLVIADPRQVVAAGGKLPSWLTGIPTLHDLEQSVAFTGRDCHLELDANYMYADGLDEAAAAEQLHNLHRRTAQQQQQDPLPAPLAATVTRNPPIPPSSSPLARELLVPSPAPDQDEESDEEDEEEYEGQEGEQDEEEGQESQKLVLVDVATGRPLTRVVASPSIATPVSFMGGGGGGGDTVILMATPFL